MSAVADLSNPRILFYYSAPLTASLLSDAYSAPLLLITINTIAEDVQLIRHVSGLLSVTADAYPMETNKMFKS